MLRVLFTRNNICNRANYLSKFVCSRRCRFLCNAIHIAATAALFSPRASVKRKDAHVLLRAYVKHMIWYKKRTNVLGDVYRKLKRKLWIFITEKNIALARSFFACIPHIQGTEGKKNIINAPTSIFSNLISRFWTCVNISVVSLRVNNRSEVNYQQ